MPNKVLVIDDSLDIHRLIKFRLAKENFELVAAYDGGSGLAMARELKPSAILLDVDLPDRDGFSVCVALKEDPTTMHIPVVFLTGAASTEEKVRGLDIGAIDYVTKPFDSFELIARVRAALRTSYLLELLSRKAMIDGLTGLWNRSYLDSQLYIQLAAARRLETPLACIMADIDHFKSINDTYGHHCGDEVLRQVALLLAEHSRVDDIVCRFGGEEFSILLPNTHLENAHAIAERLRIEIERMPISFRNNSFQITSSFGVADLRASIPLSVIELADQALYQAKKRGRNQVVAHLADRQRVEPV
ncbi:MAG: diguanylate cyclase [Pirellulaceae bacterium]|nr:diguanylate cyclase [Pirellulaceae bacterium]